MNSRKLLENYMREKNQMIFDICGKNLYWDDDFNFPYSIKSNEVNRCISALKERSTYHYNDYDDFIYGCFCPQCYVFIDECGECSFGKNHNECNSSSDSHWQTIKDFIQDRLCQKDEEWQKAIETFIKWNKII